MNNAMQNKYKLKINKILLTTLRPSIIQMIQCRFFCSLQSSMGYLIASWPKQCHCGVSIDDLMLVLFVVVYLKNKKDFIKIKLSNKN